MRCYMKAVTVTICGGPSLWVGQGCRFACLPTVSGYTLNSSRGCQSHIGALYAHTGSHAYMLRNARSWEALSCCMTGL